MEVSNLQVVEDKEGKMKKEDVIVLEDNKEYVILDVANINNEEYIYCVGLDSDEMPTENYAFLKSIKENDENYLEEITDEKILTSVISVFTARHLEETTDDEQEV